MRRDVRDGSFCLMRLNVFSLPLCWALASGLDGNFASDFAVMAAGWEADGAVMLLDWFDMLLS